MEPLLICFAKYLNISNVKGQNKLSSLEDLNWKVLDPAHLSFYAHYNYA